MKRIQSITLHVAQRRNASGAARVPRCLRTTYRPIVMETGISLFRCISLSVSHAILHWLLSITYFSPTDAQRRLHLVQQILRRKIFWEHFSQSWEAIGLKSIFGIFKSRKRLSVCLSVCMYVCLETITFNSLDVGSSYSLIRYICRQGRPSPQQS